MDAQETDVAAIWNALRTVVDPEIGLDIVTLGLVYGIDVSTTPTTVGESVRITHTLTTPGCPMEAVITSGIRSAVGRISGVGLVETNLVWDPMWHSGMIEPDAW